MASKKAEVFRDVLASLDKYGWGTGTRWGGSGQPITVPVCVMGHIMNTRTFQVLSRLDAQGIMDEFATLIRPGWKAGVTVANVYWYGVYTIAPPGDLGRDGLAIRVIEHWNDHNTLADVRLAVELQALLWEEEDKLNCNRPEGSDMPACAPQSISSTVEVVSGKLPGGSKLPPIFSKLVEEKLAVTAVMAGPQPLSTLVWSMPG